MTPPPFFLPGLSLARWRDYSDEVVNSINRFKKPLPKSRLKLLTDFFTRETIHLPPMDQFFKYALGEEVLVDLSTRQRRDLSYKWSLYPGKSILCSPPPSPSGKKNETSFPPYA